MGRELPSPESPHEQARKLMDHKNNIEAELDAHFSILKANNVTMDTPLVDREGFPRADVDIYAVRGARKRVIELRNDLKEVMEDIKKALETIYAAPPPNEGSCKATQDAEESGVQTKPFAKVDGVAPGSPASDAGLQREDLIIKFGGLTSRSFSSGSLQPLVNLVGASENRPISIDILRSGEVKSISLTPRKGWGGRGLLGTTEPPSKSKAWSSPPCCHVFAQSGQSLRERCLGVLITLEACARIDLDRVICALVLRIKSAEDSGNPPQSNWSRPLYLLVTPAASSLTQDPESLTRGNRSLPGNFSDHNLHQLRVCEPPGSSQLQAHTSGHRHSEPGAMSMSASITSSPTLINSPQTFDDVGSNHRAFHFFDDSHHIDFSNPPEPPSSPTYPDSLLFSEYQEETHLSPLSPSNTYYDDQDGQFTPRPSSLANGSMRASRISSSVQQRPAAGLQLLYTHIAHGAIHDAVVERFTPPTCHPETHLAIVDDVMSWIQYIPKPSSSGNGANSPLSPSTPTPMYASATLSFYGPHARNNSTRNRSASTGIPPSQPEYILWLTGPTSSGKSSLMQTIAERCSNTHIPNPVVGNLPLPLLAASFFFRHHRTQRNNKSKFVTTLAYQLARNVPGLGDLVEKVIERDIGVLLLGEDEDRVGGNGRGSNGLATQMEKLILEPLAHLHQQLQQSSTHPITPRVVLIEALDECINDEDQIEVLNLLRKMSQDRRFVGFFRLVVSSKPHRTIERQFALHPELDLVAYRLTLPTATKSSGKVRGGGNGRGRRGGWGLGRDGDSNSGGGKSLDVESDIKMYLECKFNEICRKWYGLPRNVGWPDANDDGNSSSRKNIIGQLVYNASGKFVYALTAVRFIMQGEGTDDPNLDPKRLLESVLDAKFTKSYQNPLAALDALYTVVIQEAAEKSGFKDASQLARGIRVIDELLSSGAGIELTVPRLALFFGFDADAGHSGEEAGCFKKALVGGLLDALLEVPVLPEEDETLPSAVRRAHMKGHSMLRQVVRFHHKSFVDFIREPTRSKGLYVSRSQLYTDLAVRYLRSASAQHSLQPVGGRAASTIRTRRSGKGMQSSPSSTSSFSATHEADVGHDQSFSAPADLTYFRRANLPYPSHAASPYAIDSDDAALFLSQLHLGRFCSFSVADAPELVKELVEFDVELWLFGIAASFELESGADGAEQRPAASRSPMMLSLEGRGTGRRPQHGHHRRVVSEMTAAAHRSSMFAVVNEGSDKDKERKRNEALLKLHGSVHPGSPGGPESDIDAMYRWVHVECSWSSCTPVCRRWRREIVKFWQRQGAPQQPSVMDRIYDKFMPRDVKRVKLITSRYRL